MTSFFKSIAENPWFNRFIIAIIILAGIVVGIQTYGEKVAAYTGLLNTLDFLILAIFTIEVVVKILAEGRQPQNYFKDPWNIFDFSIVAVCLLEPVLPVDASFLAVLRLARILRVMKLVTAVPQLQLLVGTLLKSIPSMAYVGVLLALLFYIYAAMAVFIFGANDPWHFENLQIAILSLFRITTLEDWTDIMYIAMYGCDQYSGYPGDCSNPSASPVAGALFFSSFVLIGTMIVLNLFIGVIMNSMDEMRKETELEERAEHSRRGSSSIGDEITICSDQLEQLKNQLELIGHRISKEK